MKKEFNLQQKTIVSLWIIIGFLSTASAFAGEGTGWSYSGDNGPEYWGKIDSKYRCCSSGKNQSPVNLTGMVESELPPLVIHYKANGHEVVNNGHTIQVNCKAGSTISWNGKRFELKQFHFHSPGENTIEGSSFPMELHFVHMDKNENIAVIAVMFEIGEKNHELEKIWSYMPDGEGRKKFINNYADAGQLLPYSHDYYKFNGSLTTPPCSEGVSWFVMKSFLEASVKQIDKFVNIMHHPNNRPVQPLNARIILK